MPIPYIAVLALAIIAGIAARNGQAAYCGIILAIEWGVLAAYQGQYDLATDPMWADRLWLSNSMADFGAAALVLCVPINPWKLWIAGFFVMMMIAHAAFALVPHGSVAIFNYLTVLSWLSLLQIVPIAGWIVHDLVEGYRCRRDPARRALAVDAHFNGYASQARPIE